MGHLYTKTKVFHFKDKLDSLPKENPAILAPIHIRIKPTNVCNHNCHYCAYRVDNLQLGKDMVTRDFIPREKMLEIIDDLVEMKVRAVTFSGGGEPFCYPYLLEAVKNLARGGIKFASLTNGALLTGEIANFFAKNATWLRISIDGWDSILSILQMPPGIPVATVGLDGARNAGILAAQILAAGDDSVMKRIIAFKQALGENALKAGEELKKLNYPHKTN